MKLLDSIGNKAGGLGSIVSAMGCGACFPALASLGSAIGLGFLSQYEGFSSPCCYRFSLDWPCWPTRWDGFGIASGSAAY